MNRRSFLADSFRGFSGLALAAMLHRDGFAAEGKWVPPDGKPHHTPKAKSVIWLFMNGGVSHMETFDPKPGSSSGGETKATATSVPGIQIAENWSETAKVMDDLAIVRSMSNKEGNHQRATYQLHTGYVPSGSVKHPSFGSLVCSELANANFDLPHFVSIQGATPGAAFLRDFVEDAKASGLVARLIERHHIRGLSVAPPA